MTRLALASFGAGVTCTLWVASLWGHQACLAVSFAGGVGFTVGVMVVALLVVRWIGLKMGWLTVFHVEHSQPLDQPKDTSPY